MVESPPDSTLPGISSDKVVIVLKRIVQLLIVVACLSLLTVVVSFVELDGWRGVEMLGGWRNWFFNTMNAGWFYYVLIRITALFLAVLAVRRLWRWSRTAGASVAALLAFGLITFTVMKSYSPAGIYGDIDEIERFGGDHYFVFADGKFEDVDKDDVFYLGHYEKTANGWILTQGHTVYKLKSSCFGIWMINAKFAENYSILGRRIIPFLRPKWMPIWLQ